MQMSTLVLSICQVLYFWLS